MSRIGITIPFWLKLGLFQKRSRSSSFSHAFNFGKKKKKDFWTNLFTSG